MGIFERLLYPFISLKLMSLGLFPVFKFSSMLDLNLVGFLDWIIIVLIVMSQIIIRDFESKHSVYIVPYLRACWVLNNIILWIVSFNDLNQVVSTQFTIDSFDDLPFWFELISLVVIEVSDCEWA